MASVANPAAVAPVQRATKSPNLPKRMRVRMRMPSGKRCRAGIEASYHKNRGRCVAEAKRDVLVIIETDAVSLRYYPPSGIVHHEIRRFVHGQEFRDLLSEGARAFRKYGACKWLSDDRGNGPLKPSDRDWARDVWGPDVMAAGWKFWAVVLPAKAMAQMNMQRWIGAYAKQGVTVRAFEDPYEAMAWLKAQE